MTGDILTLLGGTGMFLLGMQSMTGALADLASRQTRAVLVNSSTFRPSSENRKLAARSGTESPAGTSCSLRTSTVFSPVSGFTRTRSGPLVPGRRSDEK